MLSFSLTPPEIQATSFGFLFFVLAIAAFFILTTSYHDRMARYFAFTALFGALINIFSFLYHTTNNLELAREYRIISQSFSVTFLWLLLIFSIVLYEKYLPPVRLYRILAWGISLIMGVSLPVFVLDALGYGFYIGPLLGAPAVTLTPEPGPYFLFHIGWFTLGALYALFLLLMIAVRGQDRAARVMGLLMVLCVAAPTLSRTLGYLPWYHLGSTGFSSLAVVLLSGPLFAFGTTYAILRHKVFNIRLITTELFIFALWCFLFLRALLSHSWSAALPDIALLGATIVLGVFLIRSVLREVEQREKLEILAGELRDLNENLEVRVKERTEELSRSKVHIETVIESLTVGLIEYDEKGVVYRLNKAAEELLGVKRLEVVRKGASKIPPAVRAILSAVKRKEQKNVELEHSLPENMLELSIENPRHIDLQITTVPVSLEQGSGRGYVKLLRDITREKAIDRNKSEFISTAAHQLRTPLAALRWTFETFLDGGIGRVSKAQKEILEQGKSASVNMIRVVNDLLNVARIEEGRFDYELKEGKIADALENIRPTLLTLASTKRIKLDFEGFDAIPAFSFDSNKLMLALQNLVDNAIKYSPDMAHVKVLAKVEKKTLALSVADQGIGIPKEDQEKLFTKFFRSRGATAMFTDGSGLGLFIVKNIVDKHAGTIVVESNEGKGTTFTMRIPLAHH